MAKKRLGKLVRTIKPEAEKPISCFVVVLALSLLSCVLVTAAGGTFFQPDQTIRTIAVIVAAGSVFLVLMGLLFSYALTPLVDRLVRAGVPRALGAAAVMIALVGGLAWGTWSLSDQANSLITSLPDAAQKLRDTLHKLGSEPRYEAARAGLMIAGIQDVPGAAYSGLLDYEREAAELGYPELI